MADLPAGADDRLKPERPKSVLVVDDEPAVRRLLGLTLGAEGFEVVEARDGAQALGLMAQGTFDVVLLDRTMPGIDGIDVLRRIRATPATATLPVILLTGVDQSADLVAGLDAGADDYIVKPFETDELLARVRAQLREQSAWEEVISRHASERAALLRSVASAAACGTPTAAATHLVDQLLGLPEVAGAVCVEVVSDRVRVLATAGVGVLDLLVSDPTSTALGRYLAARGEQGPWRETVAGTADCPPAIAAAPITSDGELVALLLTVPGNRAPLAEIDSLLATTISFAELAGSLFGTGLRSSATKATARARYQQIAATNAFDIVFQPIVELDTGAVVGLEALSRFHDATPPDRAFTEAAMLGVGNDLEVATLAVALGVALELPQSRWLCVNVSPRLLAEVEPLRAMLARRRGLVVVELSEHERVEDYVALRAAISALGARVLLSVDDAGSGFASLAHILALKAEFVKLDKAWIRHIERDPARQALVAGLQHFADQTGASLIAEGIESPAELAQLSDIGVRFGQGFLLGRPAALEELH